MPSPDIPAEHSAAHGSPHHGCREVPAAPVHAETREGDRAAAHAPEMEDDLAALSDADELTQVDPPRPAGMLDPDNPMYH